MTFVWLYTTQYTNQIKTMGILLALSIIHFMKNIHFPTTATHMRLEVERWMNRAINWSRTIKSTYYTMYIECYTNSSYYFRQVHALLRDLTFNRLVKNMPLCYRLLALKRNLYKRWKAKTEAGSQNNIIIYLKKTIETETLMEKEFTHKRKIKQKQHK